MTLKERMRRKGLKAVLLCTLGGIGGNTTLDLLVLGGGAYAGKKGIEQVKQTTEGQGQITEDAVNTSLETAM
jgi:hypothetical protein